MKKSRFILTFVCCLCAVCISAESTSTVSPREDASKKCEFIRDLTGLPSYYCDCEEDNTKFKLPMDITIRGDMWFKVDINEVAQGMTAYLYSDSEVKLDVYAKCLMPSPSYSYTFSPNQARDVDSDKISQKLEEAGVSDIANLTSIYFRIYSVDGTEGRILCYAYNQGPHSTCDDCLPLLLSMTFVSSHPQDVYVLAADELPDDKGVRVKWTSDAACRMRVTRGDCNGETVIEADVNASGYKLPKDLLTSVKESGDNLYLHFTHDEGTVGRIRLNQYTYPTTDVNDLHIATDARIVLTPDGQMYIIRDNQRYTLTGSKIDNGI